MSVWCKAKFIAFINLYILRVGSSTWIFTWQSKVKSIKVCECLLLFLRSKFMLQNLPEWKYLLTCGSWQRIVSRYQMTFLILSMLGALGDRSKHCLRICIPSRICSSHWWAKRLFALFVTDLDNVFLYMPAIMLSTKCLLPWWQTPRSLFEQKFSATFFWFGLGLPHHGIVRPSAGNRFVLYSSIQEQSPQYYTSVLKIDCAHGCEMWVSGSVWIILEISNSVTGSVVSHMGRHCTNSVL